MAQENILTKSELIENVATRMNSSKSVAQEAIEAMLDEMIKALSKNDKKITLPGFGSFEVTTRKARDGRNPQTGEKIRIEESRTVKFKISKPLKDALKN